MFRYSATAVAPRKQENVAAYLEKVASFIKWYTIVYKVERIMLQDLTGGNPIVIVVVFVAVVWLLTRSGRGTGRNGKD